MIFDCFLYNGERDMLDLRMAHLSGTADVFIAVQSRETFAGEPREIAEVPGGCVNFVAPPMATGYRADVLGMTEEGRDRWMREAWQRNYQTLAIAQRARTGDYALFGDVDEIPAACDVREAREGVYVMDMRRYWLNVSTGERWAGTVGLVVTSGLPQAQALRNDRYGMPQAGKGWHFSYCGQDLHSKLRAFSHAEYDTPECHAQIEANRAALVDPFGREARRFDVVDTPGWVDRGKFGGLVYG